MQESLGQTEKKPTNQCQPLRGSTGPGMLVSDAKWRNPKIIDGNFNAAEPLPRSRILLESFAELDLVLAKMVTCPHFVEQGRAQ